MSFKLRINFGGLIAFATREDGKKAWAFFVDATRIFERRPGIPSHQSVIRFDLADLFQANQPSNIGLCLLNGVDLRILPGGEPVESDSLKLVEFTPGASEPDFALPPDQLSPKHDSFSWVAPLSRSRPGSEIRPELLSDSLAALAAASLAARIHLSQGELKNHDFSKDGDGGGVIYRFPDETDAGGHRQLFSAEVRLEMKIDAPFVELRGERFDGGDPVSLKLAPPPDLVVPDGELPTVDIKILNEESDQLIPSLKPKQEVKVGDPRPQDTLFEEFFALCVPQRLRSNPAFPVIDRVLSPTPGVAVGSPPCSPARI
jgi:hypothetical protein